MDEVSSTHAERDFARESVCRFLDKPVMSERRRRNPMRGTSAQRRLGRKPTPGRRIATEFRSVYNQADPGWYRDPWLVGICQHRAESYLAASLSDNFGRFPTF
jgi:hypothetical protein